LSRGAPGRAGAAAVCLVVLAGALFGLRAHSPAADKPARAKWEYAELRLTGLGTVVFEGPKGVTKAANYKEMAEALGGKAANSNSTEVLNQLGSDGWELVGHTVYVAEGAKRPTQVWTLKRGR
jgi:hypothetical protein